MCGEAIKPGGGGGRFRPFLGHFAPKPPLERPNGLVRFLLEG